MTCRECSEFLSDYLAGALPETVRDTFEVHLSRCPNCVVYLEQFRSTIRASQQALGSTAEDTDAPEDLIRAILAARKG